MSEQATQGLDRASFLQWCKSQADGYDAWGAWQEGARRAIASFYPSPVEGWQPIETAPKDGTRFLAYQHGRQIEECWWQEDWPNWTGWQNDWDSEPCPTHWMPLPAPPVEGWKRGEEQPGSVDSSALSGQGVNRGGV